ncbi:PREDICTED: nucleoredoxin-like [Branchiostoma belcheri]|uniref:Nucleoredoxin n=1 Tax=Branchiostoma belcheri TaxID=7741 RepID=A0A6P4Y8K6_BRABE|nr:PREDICTED: nucleoredoxin-like [Branchiostoma belcheri]
MSSLQALLGDKLQEKVGEKESLATESLVGEGRYVGLYFSAHWCPPCRGFTPKLADFYREFKATEKGKNFEIIFVSSDRDQASFDEYYGEMPWLALPYPDRDRKAKLSKKFKVQGIPTFVILDASTGKLITKDGRLRVSEDPKAESFPWHPKPLSEILQGKLLRRNGESTEEVDVSTLAGRPVGLYFSAHWCPPCRSFTPVLAKTYQKIKDENKDFEIIFASSDRAEESFNDYFKTMPWLALPYEDPRKKTLSQMYGIAGIPTLIIVENLETGKIITKDGRGAVGADPDGKEFPWIPKPLNMLEQQYAGTLNEETSVILFTDGSDKGMEDAKQALQPIADASHAKTAEKGEDPDLFFFYAGEDEIVDSLRDFASLEDRDPLLVILDIPDQKIYVCPEEEVTQEVAKDFVEKYQAGSLEPKALRG